MRIKTIALGLILTAMLGSGQSSEPNERSGSASFSFGLGRASTGA